MINRHSTFFFNKIEPTIHCDKQIGYVFTGGTYEIPYPVKALQEWEHNLETCTGCNINHKDTIKNKEEHFKGFPNCCEWHIKLNKVSWFDKKDFKDIPQQYADKLYFSWFHIIHYLTAENWKKEIFDYLEYVISAFGSFPPEYGSPLYLTDYFSHLKQLLKGDFTSENISRKEIIKRKKEITEYLDKYWEIDTNTDLNILIGTYNKWLKIFPFEISFFASLKPRFEKQLPLINGKLEKNKYTGLSTGKLHTKDTLICVLQSLTLNLLDKINVPELRNQGLITDIQAKQLEFIEAVLKTKTAEITKQFSKGELKYIKALKKWLQLHKEYFNEITPFVKDLTPQQMETFKSKDAYKEQNLFKVGLLFAKGEMNKYFTINSKNETIMNSEFTAPKIARDLGNENYNKWILASINNYTTDKENGNKNIFNSIDMMSKIISHCEAENIPIDTYFKSRLPIE